MQLTPFGVERVILEEIAQVAIPSQGHLRNLLERISCR
jgi:hypothetical protein